MNRTDTPSSSLYESRPSVYIFGWPSHVGGADTKLHHLLLLLHGHCEIMVIPNDSRLLAAGSWVQALDGLGVRYGAIEDLPATLEGFALALCNEPFFHDRIAHRAKDKGLKIVWSGEMMWHHRGELDAFREGLVDRVLYVSEVQRSRLASGHGAVPFHVTGNYIDPSLFPFKDRRHPVFTIGRLSRAAPEKYPEDFPVFYECLDLADTRFRVMAWDANLRAKYRWHQFDHRWDLLAAGSEPSAEFLHSLDLFVYPLGHQFIESWGRSTVEAMLTGSIPLVPGGHNFQNLIVHGETGFVCQDFMDYKCFARNLRFDFAARQRISRQCHEHAVRKLCNKSEHLKAWLEVFQ